MGDGFTVATVTDNTHGAVVGNFVTFSDAASLGGNVTAAVLNQEYEIVSVPTVNTYTINLSVTGNASDSGQWRRKHRCCISNRLRTRYSSWRHWLGI